jgi:acetate kinase
MISSSPSIVAGLLAVNTGSSSLKLALYRNGLPLTELSRISVEPIGGPGTRIRATSAHGLMTNEPTAATDHRTALLSALDYARQTFGFSAEAVGHRVVHGGVTHVTPERINEALLSDLRVLTRVDPEHMPQALEAVAAITEHYPDIPQVACFDTAFHRTMPLVAQRYALPQWTVDVGVRRYGFHGLSCEFIVSKLAEFEPATLGGRSLIAHLGNGASITAVQRGVSVETTMGFSPTGGVMMGTRSGDLDPTVLTYLGRTAHKDLDALDRLTNHESGLLGVSGLSSDVRVLLDASASASAREAIDLFCYAARKYMGALAAVLDGVDTVVFTGGIGEHAPVIRDSICRGLGHLGVRLDPERNTSNADVISAADSAAIVRVIATDEELVIAKHVQHLLG